MIPSHADVIVLASLLLVASVSDDLRDDPVKRLVETYAQASATGHLTQIGRDLASDPARFKAHLRRQIEAIDRAISEAPDSPAVPDALQIKLRYLPAVGEWREAERISLTLADRASTIESRLDFLVRSMHLRGTSTDQRTPEYLDASAARWESVFLEFQDAKLDSERTRSHIASGLIHTASDIARMAFEADSPPATSLRIAAALDVASTRLSRDLDPQDAAALQSTGRGPAARLMRSALLYGIAGQTEEATARLTILLHDHAAEVPRIRLKELVRAIERGDPAGATDATRSMLDTATDLREQLELRLRLAELCATDPIEARPMLESLFSDAHAEARFGEAWAAHLAMNACRALGEMELRHGSRSHALAWNQVEQIMAEWRKDAAEAPAAGAVPGPEPTTRSPDTR